MTSSLRFVTRVGCTLCGEAEQRLRQAAGRRGIVIEMVDVDEDPYLLTQYGDLVPVVLSSSGELLSSGPLSTRRADAITRKTRSRWRG